MSTLTPDHLAIVARTLAEGCEYVQECLGVKLLPGGKHPQMGTHNCLARLGKDEFIEVIAIDPDAERPHRPRWFNLDKHGDREPCLAHWIARAHSLDETLPVISASVGEPMSCSRGELNWRLTVPDDGSFAFEGLFPSIIEWPMRPFPGASMADIGCRLIELSLTHPQADRLSAAFEGLMSDARVCVSQGDSARLSARIMTPTGERVLG